ncbi:MAG: SDR family NAD(P)-dependent oxidoreductase [Phenylobacterium sp.]|uniref:SDR family NAD(P)-dependent oxidoreductase n=1 Tax=Phenylobacterium sp. TaxID=1871053 RepID=UPI002716AF0B|nr:SDR family NAD(P)-dependent oxidoreductase [Phenylobacterium sp.]MDO8914418.1 SDR family NAD(P)-dependent oxidoreductase [Phenylobacterium sp.]MDP2010427.1 SDR family NAD(P)-dependent oxidoreductase [Phenylobacterium sp.]MDP3100727.1 SDR family NAD(P)-dependent oxidoreductase [Phenylobacterium sp.]MDP3867932.1 SDR family NAD(P)-dependent oxidoreductase [Phenylobacterium sp.]
MRDLTGKTAFITGGASGLGLAMAHAFGEAGMNVMLADIEEAPLAAAVQDLEDRQIRASGVLCDVAVRNAVEAAAAKTIETFGKVHLVCNNAGVGAGGPIDQVRHADWEWILAVNLMGVVYGMETFLPLIRAHGEGGAFVNTASMAGMISPPGMEPYSATKFAVVAMSEGWAGQLAPEGINVSALCPGFVKTKINQSGRTRQAQFGGPVDSPVVADSMVDNGIDPERVGRRVLEAVQAGERYIFTHPDMRPFVEARFAGIMSAFDVAAASPALAGMDYKTPDLSGMAKPS